MIKGFCAKGNQISTDRQRGVTLVELLLVLSLVGTLAGLTAFGLAPLFDRGRLHQGVRSVTALIRRAHAEALSRSQAVSMQFVDGSGVSIWLDADADQVIDSGELLLGQFPRAGQAWDSNHRLDLAALTALSVSNTLLVDSQGMLINPQGQLISVVVGYEDTSLDASLFGIEITAGGAIRVIGP